MDLSDILTVLSILVAVIALLSEDNRKIILIKFDWRHWTAVVFTVIFIHVILSFEWLLGVIPVLSALIIPGWPTPGAWGYMFTVGLLLFLFWMIAFAPFSPKKINDVKALYQSMLLRNEGDKLVNAIQKNHLKHVVSYLKELNKIEKEFGQRLERRMESIDNSIDGEKARKEIETKIETLKRRSALAYAAMLYNTFFKNDRFISMAVSSYPLLYTDIIKNLNSKRTADSHLVQTFYKCLIQTNDEQFKEELRSLYFLDMGLQYSVTEKQPLLHTLVDNLDVIIHNNAWKAFGDAALEELKTDLQRSATLLTTVPPLGPYEDSKIWDTASKKVITFFDIIVRKAILNRLNENIHMYYLKDMLNELTSPSLKYAFTGNIRAYTLAIEIRDMHVKWCTNLLTLYEEAPLTDTILRQLIEIQVILCNNDRDKAVEHIRYVFSLLAEISNEEDPTVLHPLLQTYIDLFSERIREIIAESKVNNKRILEATNEVWENRDRPKFSAPRYAPFLSYFEEQVVTLVSESES